MTLKTLTLTGKSGTLKVDSTVFEAKINKSLIAQAIRVYLANQRQANGAVKTRAVVARTKRKWYRQKGTGNARHGARSAHIFVGGGVAHGPKSEQHFQLKLTQKMKQAALRSALSAQVENILVVDQVEKLLGKTKPAAELLKTAKMTNSRILIVLSEINQAILRSLRNIPKLSVTIATDLNTYDVAQAKHIIVTTQSVKKLTDRLAIQEKNVVKKIKLATKKTQVKADIKPKTKSSFKKEIKQPKTKKTTKKTIKQ